MAVAVAYFLAKIRVFQGAGVPFNPEATAVGRNLVLLLVAWAVLSSVVASRWKGQVQEDERDREIARHASGWWRGALIVFLVGLAVMLGLDRKSTRLNSSHQCASRMP